MGAGDVLSLLEEASPAIGGGDQAKIDRPLAKGASGNTGLMGRVW
jgi:hypothetical protein